LILVAAIVKYFEVLQASRWPSVEGRIVTSTTRAGGVSAGDADDDDTQTRTFAKIEYVYTLQGREYRGHRVSISEGETMGNDPEIAAMLKRYPVGKTVTVYYDPRKKDKALLERDVPSWLWKGVAWMVFGIVAFVIAVSVGFSELGHVLAGVVTNPE